MNDPSPGQIRQQLERTTGALHLVVFLLLLIGGLAVIGRTWGGQVALGGALFLSPLSWWLAHRIAARLAS